jgi:hypothetical protein
MGAVLSGPQSAYTRARGNPRLRTDADREPEHERRYCLREITPLRRDAIYGYLQAVYDLVSMWSAEELEVDRARRALRLRGLHLWPREDVFAAIIRRTAEPARADKRTRSKWSRVLRFVKMQKDEKEPFAGFIKRKGGINECNARYGRCLRRLAASRRSITEFQRRSASERTAMGRRIRA